VLPLPLAGLVAPVPGQQAEQQEQTQAQYHRHVHSGWKPCLYPSYGTPAFLLETAVGLRVRGKAKEK